MVAPAIRGAKGGRPSADRGRAQLHTRLQARRAEIEQAVITRISAISDSGDPGEVTQAAELRKGIAAALDATLATLSTSPGREVAVPAALLAQARLAARSGLKLDTLLRRYFAGHSLFCDFLIEEAAEVDRLDSRELKHLLRNQATLCDRLFAAASEEYERESRTLHATSQRRRVERVERLLAGELVDASQLGYDLDGHHLGLLAKGEGAEAALRKLAATLDSRLLTVPRPDGTAWAWFGGRREIDFEDLKRLLAKDWPAQLTLAAGEPEEGPAGWRFTHRQAKAAMTVAQRRTEPFTRYRDVALLASVVQDDLLTISLRKLYLERLEAGRDSGEVLKETLRAYFAAGRNVTSAAAALGISRQAANSRLHAIEHHLPRPLSDCAADLEIALQVDALSPRPRLPSPMD